jgi:ABC-2 type transport system permease protein
MREIMAVVYREYLVRITGLTWMFFDLAVPLLYLVMFGVAFDRALGQGFVAGGQAISYNAFFLAGVLSMTCFGNALNTSYGFFVDRDNGILFEFLTYPMTRGEFLLGKIIYQCIMTVLQSILTLFVSAFLLDVSIPWHSTPLILTAMIVGTAAWFFFLSVFAFLIRRNDTFNLVINMLYFVLMFLSSVFYPLENVPGWVRTVASLNPLSWHADFLRYLTIGTGELNVIMFEVGGFVLFLFASFWVAIKALQKTL